MAAYGAYVNETIEITVSFDSNTINCLLKFISFSMAKHKYKLGQIRISDIFKRDGYILPNKNILMLN